MFELPNIFKTFNKCFVLVNHLKNLLDIIIIEQGKAILIIETTKCNLICLPTKIKKNLKSFMLKTQKFIHQN